MPGMAVAAGHSLGSPLRTAGLRCEFKTNPLGIDRLQPRLSWVLLSGDPALRGQYQSAWQVLVASSLSLLAEGKADVWNSGRREGRVNTNIFYQGKALQSGGVYHWKVRIWDSRGQMSNWSRPARWTMGLLSPADWQAEWVTDSKAPPAEDSLLFQDNPAPLYRKDFMVKRGIRRAVLYISGVGYYEATLNGKKIGDHFLDPGWTDYRKTIFYNTYDITAILRKGHNCIGVELGNGWYNSLPLRLWGRLNPREFLATGKPRFIARLEIEYMDGSRHAEVSDGSWHVMDGPLRRNNNYIGSVYDGRYAIDGWGLPGFDDRGWRGIRVTESPGGQLVSQEQPPIRAGRPIRPVGIRRMDGIARQLGGSKWLGGDKYIVDMGRNFGGVIRLRVSGKKGTHVTLRYGELLNPDGSLNVMTSVAGQIKGGGMGGPGAPDVAWQQDDCILGDKGIIFQPSFTFHGFRYVEITGLPEALTSDMIQGIPLSSDVQPAGSFYCSDSLFNRIQDAARNTFLSNLFSVQSDCPHREKLGYGGDIVATSEAFMANFDMHDFYAKTVRDYADEAQRDGGLPETAPYVGISDEGLTNTSGPIGWGTVLPLLLRQLYQYYGDTVVIMKYYPVARDWVDFLQRHASDLIISKGIGDHESLDTKQVELTSTAFFYYNIELMRQLAVIINKQDDVVQYRQLAAAVKDAFIKKFYDPANGEVGIHTEATQAFALYFHLLPEGEEDRALNVLLDKVKEKKEHIATGIFGTKYLMEVLSEFGCNQAGCMLAGQKGFPGWGYMLENGATTLWEHWAFSDNTFSHNHPMFGSVSGWFYKYLAGIRPDPDAVAYNRLILQPGGFRRLSFARAEYQSPQGVIITSWRIRGDTMYYDVTIPVNASASILLPAVGAEHILEGGRSLSAAGIAWKKTGRDRITCQVASGRYRFRVRLNEE